jgi:HEAT repeat protein
MQPRHFVWLAVVLILTVVVRAAEPDPEVATAEKTLRDAKIETTPAALLQFFRQRTLTAKDRDRLADAVRRLGEDDFETREKAEEELLRAGRTALPFLHRALKDEDFERSQRAKRCVQQIDSESELVRVAAAARLVADRKPEGAVAVLLAYLSGAESEFVEDELVQALLVLGMKDGKPDPALTKALTDDEPLRRAAAGRVLGQIDPAQRSAVHKLLEDVEPRVRFEAALGLVRSGEKEAVPALIALLGKGPMPLAWKAQEILYRIAGDKSPPLPLTEDDAPKRAKVAEAWNAWWKDAGSAVELAKIKLDQTLQGINLICQEPNGTTPARVWACRGDGKPLWEIKDVMAWDAQLLPNGHVLIAERNAYNRITERDTAGKILMEVPLANAPGACQRLPNGNTFIAMSNEVLEVDPKGKTLWSHSDPGGQYVARAFRRRDGHIIYAAGGYRVVETDTDFKELRASEVTKTGDSWMSVEPLPGNRFLIAPYSAHKVMEIDSDGKVLWECPTQTPMSAVRLPNGNTLVGSDRDFSVYEYDRSGKEVWKLRLDSGVRCVRRY